MPVFRIHGASRETGEELKFPIVAKDREAAVAVANDMGVVVARIDLEQAPEAPPGYASQASAAPPNAGSSGSTSATREPATTMATPTGFGLGVVGVGTRVMTLAFVALVLIYGQLEYEESIRSIKFGQQFENQFQSDNAVGATANRLADLLDELQTARASTERLMIWGFGLVIAFMSLLTASLPRPKR